MKLGFVPQVHGAELLPVRVGHRSDDLLKIEQDEFGVCVLWLAVSNMN